MCDVIVDCFSRDDDDDDDDNARANNINLEDMAQLESTSNIIIVLCLF